VAAEFLPAKRGTFRRILRHATTPAVDSALFARGRQRCGLWLPVYTVASCVCVAYSVSWTRCRRSSDSVYDPPVSAPRSPPKQPLARCLCPSRTAALPRTAAGPSRRGWSPSRTTQLPRTAARSGAIRSTLPSPPRRTPPPPLSDGGVLQPTRQLTLIISRDLNVPAVRTCSGLEFSSVHKTRTELSSSLNTYTHIHVIGTFTSHEMEFGNCSSRTPV